MKKGHSKAVKQIHDLLDAGDVLSARLLAANIVEDQPGSDDAREAAEVLERLRTPRFAYGIVVIGALAFLLLLLRALGLR